MFGSKDGCGAGPCCPREPAAGALPPEGPWAAGPGLQRVLAEECSCPALSTLWRGLCSASMPLTFSVSCDSIGCGAALCLMSLWGLGGNGQPIKIWNIEKVRAIWWGHNNSPNYWGIASLAASPKCRGCGLAAGWGLHCMCSWGRAELSSCARTSVGRHIGYTSARRVGETLIQKEPSEPGLCLHLCGGRGEAVARVFSGLAGRSLP